MPTHQGSPGLRLDANRNRDAILRAARTTFAADGVDAPLDRIARDAGVGIATLYRRFPTREDLIAAAFEPKMAAYVAAAATATADPDPWNGFTGYVRAVCAMQAEDAGFADVVALTFPPTAKLDRQLRKATAGINDVVERAKAAGRLRDDFVLEDLAVLLIANAGVVTTTRGHAPTAWERFTAYMLAAFEAPARSVLPAPVAPARLSLAIRRHAGSR